MHEGQYHRSPDLDEPTADILPEPHSDAAWHAPVDTATGDTIGPYHILEKLGEGGFGVVYLAEQTEPVKRRVALKIIKLGMDTKQVVARFEVERQALAMMDHPNIAKVLDAGATSTGRPYFVMEYVRGVPITEHCDRQRLGINERLELFIKVCHALQHAHEKQLIHRDIKPSNILVDASGEPKVIDFGVAKAICQRLTEHTIFTAQGQLIGTPEYMSPEQAEMTAQDIDTRSDVYSLGAVLYELLTGALPFERESLRAAALGEIQRIIREEEPPRPSTRLSSLATATDRAESVKRIAEARRTELRALTGILRRDLDWVVMKCLEKNRDRRYASASELATDVSRYLNCEPVIAGPPTLSYQWSRKLRRQRQNIILAAAVAAVFIIGVLWLVGGNRNQAPDTATADPAMDARSSPTSTSEPDVDSRADSTIDDTTPTSVVESRPLDIATVSGIVALTQVNVIPNPLDQNRVRLTGPVVNEHELETIRDRLMPFGDQVDLEVIADAKAVRRLLERDLNERGVRNVSVIVRTEKNWGPAYLAIRFTSDETFGEAEVRAIAESYVIDPNLVRLTEDYP